MFKQVQHIGVACASIDDTLGLLKKLFDAEEVANRLHTVEGAQTSALVRIGENSYYELMEPYGPNAENGVVGRYLAKYGPGFHHLGVHVGSMDEISARFEAAGYQMLGKKTGDGGTHAFSRPKDSGGVLYEFDELADLDRKV